MTCSWKTRRIKQAILDDLDGFKRIAENASSTRQLSTHYGLPRNGKHTKWFKDLMREVGLDPSVYTRMSRAKRRRYQRVERECPVCHKPFIAQQGDKREAKHCSRACANRRLGKTPRSQASRQKTAHTLRRLADERGRRSVNRPATEERPCSRCSKPFLPKLDRTRFCSSSCKAKAQAARPGDRELRAAIQRRVIAEGRHKGWVSRAKLAPSYPERFFISVLEREGVTFERERSCRGFFIDFAIVLPSGFQIALEIDGKQHKEPDRQERDRRKDLALEAAGWNVYRIPWRSINSASGKAAMKRQIDGFLAYHKAMSF